MIDHRMTENPISWEQSLQQLRERRAAESAGNKEITNHNTSTTITQTDENITELEFSSETPIAPMMPSEKIMPPKQAQTTFQPDSQITSARASSDDYRHVLQEYLQQWQDSQNAQLSEEQQQNDALVMLQEDWLEAQNSLQSAFANSQVESSQTLWFNPKHPKNPTDDTQAHLPASSTQASEVYNLPVSINVLNPQLSAYGRPILCLSEQELTERLRERLIPHLTDAVNGMVRTTLQRQLAQISLELRQTFDEEIPTLVDELIDYNLQTVLAEIKYSLRTKKR